MIDFGSVRCLNLSMIDETGPHIFGKRDLSFNLTRARGERPIRRRWSGFPEIVDQFEQSRKGLVFVEIQFGNSSVFIETTTSFNTV